MKKVKNIVYVYVLQNSLKQYGRFDIYGWDKTGLFVYATKFSSHAEAELNEKILNYVTAGGSDTQFKIVAKAVRVKRFPDE